MKRLILVLVLIALALPVFAQEFPDVPPDHWAYQAVKELADAGIIQGYPDGTFGGKRAMTRYEFAQALSKAIPVIEQQVLAKIPPCATNPCPDLSKYATKDDLNNYVTKDQLAALQKLIDEFRDELAALGVDVEALRRDVAALNERVTALEAEVARVRFNGVADAMGRGEVANQITPVFDRDNRDLSLLSPTDRANPLANSAAFVNLDFGMKAKAGEAANVNLAIMAGNYVNFALYRDFQNGAGVPASLLPAANAGLTDFQLWNMYVDLPVKLGSSSAASVVAGRYSFQLTPLTLKFVDSDSYTYVPVLDSGDYVFDGARAFFNMGKLTLTAFAQKNDPISDANNGNGSGNTLMSPNLQFNAVNPFVGLPTSQMAGLRAVIGTPLNGNLGLTWYQMGMSTPFPGRESVYGADLNTMFGKLGFAGEYATSDPNDSLRTAFPALNTSKFGWNANLSYLFGKLDLGAGYSQIGSGYAAPGYWMRTGRAINLQNIKGWNASLTYPFGSQLSLVAEGQFLEPDKDLAVTGRTAVDQGQSVLYPAGALNTLTYWRAGLRYGLTAANSVDLGWEQSNWGPNIGNDTREQYVTIGYGHAFNANSNLKLLYQIIDFTAGTTNPYITSSSPDGRGGVAAAQFELKY
jgi:hypothetical protein